MNRPLSNISDKPLGIALPGWQPPPSVTLPISRGQLCCLEALNVEDHSADLYAAQAADEGGSLFTYLPYGPFADEVEYKQWMTGFIADSAHQLYAIIDQVSDQAVGHAGYLRIRPEAGSVEVGHVYFSPALQRTAAATEAMYLMMKQAFDWGYRRYEWKCHSMNAGSVSAALRLGFTYEGTFRNDCVIKGRNRNTSWFSITSEEWPDREQELKRWLSPQNFSVDGQQLSPLQQANNKAAG